MDLAIDRVSLLLQREYGYTLPANIKQLAKSSLLSHKSFQFKTDLVLQGRRQSFNLEITVNSTTLPTWAYVVLVGVFSQRTVARHAVCLTN